MPTDLHLALQTHSERVEQLQHMAGSRRSRRHLDPVDALHRMSRRPTTSPRPAPIAR